MTDILVAGAGPAGLALALQAHAHGADVRIIDQRAEGVRPSRALIRHARTLEVLRPLGVTQALLVRADTAPAAGLRLGCRIVRVTFGDLALPDTAFPHLTLIRQMDVERVLAAALAERGIEAERGTELAAVRDEPGVSARSCARRPYRRRPGSASPSPATARPALSGPRPACAGPAALAAGLGAYPVSSGASAWPSGSRRLSGDHLKLAPSGPHPPARPPHGTPAGGSPLFPSA
jgi:hypothetical protein